MNPIESKWAKVNPRKHKGTQVRSNNIQVQPSETKFKTSAIKFNQPSEIECNQVKPSTTLLNQAQISATKLSQVFTRSKF